MKLQVYRPWIPSMFEVSGDLIRRSPVRKRMSERRNSSATIEARSTRSSSFASARNCFRGLLTSGMEDVPSCPVVRDTELGYVFVGRGSNTAKPPLTPVAAELDKLKELYKKKNKTKTLIHDKTQTRSNMSHRVQRSRRHYIHTYRDVHSITLALLWNHVCTHNRATPIRSHIINTGINAH